MAASSNKYSFRCIHMLTPFCIKTNLRENRFFAAKCGLVSRKGTYNVKIFTKNITTVDKLTSWWAQPSFHLFTFSPFYPFTFSPFHLFTFSPFHLFIFSPFHLFTLSPFHPFTLSPFHPFIFSPFHLFTLSSFHPFTFSPLKPHLSIIPRNNDCIKVNYLLILHPKINKRTKRNHSSTVFTDIIYLTNKGFCH